MNTVRTRLLAMLAALVPAAALAQSPQAGQLLVATTALDDPNFSETVVLLLAHAEQGSVGIFINRPTWVTADEAFPDIEALDRYTGTIYLGGPLDSTELILLLDVASDPPESLIPVVDSVYASGDPSVLQDIDTTDGTEIRVYAGRVAWSPGQLENEIEGGVWRVLPARREYIFPADTESLWQRLPSGTDRSASAHPGVPVTPSRPNTANPSTSRFPIAFRD